MRCVYTRGVKLACVSRYGFPQLNATYHFHLKRNYRQEFLKCTFLPAELERGAEVLQFDVWLPDQNFDCGCDRCAILNRHVILMRQVEVW